MNLLVHWENVYGSSADDFELMLALITGPTWHV